MASFIRKLFGGGKKPKPAPAPKPKPAPALKAKADPAKQTADSNRRGRARNRTVHTDVLGLSSGQKSGLQRKYVTGA